MNDFIDFYLWKGQYRGVDPTVYGFRPVSGSYYEMWAATGVDADVAMHNLNNGQCRLVCVLLRTHPMFCLDGGLLK